MRACLDAWAVIAWLEDSPGAREMAHRLDGTRACMSWVNAGEVHYVVTRRVSREVADQTIAQLQVDVDLVDATGPRILAASAIKAAHRMSYADCFAVATALEFRAPLITTDPEIAGAGVRGLTVIGLADA